MEIFSGLTILMLFGLVGVLAWVTYRFVRYSKRPTDQIFAVAFGVFGVNLFATSVVATVLWFQEFG